MKFTVILILLFLFIDITAVKFCSYKNIDKWEWKEFFYRNKSLSILSTPLSPPKSHGDLLEQTLCFNNKPARKSQCLVHKGLFRTDGKPVMPWGSLHVLTQGAGQLPCWGSTISTCDLAEVGPKGTGDHKGDTLPGSDTLRFTHVSLIS